MDVGESNLTVLIRDMAPYLDAATYVFALAPPGFSPESPPLMRFREVEGETVVLTVDAADAAGLPTDRRFRRITLTIHSDLNATGLTAAVSRCLDDAGIPANVVAAYYHDHIFVPEEEADRAVQALEALTMSG